MLATHPDIIQENKALLQAILDAYNIGDVEKACSYTHPDCTLNGEPFGREGDLQRSHMMMTPFPDQVWTWDSLVAEDDWVATRFTFKGTFKNSMGEYPPNGKEVIFTGVSVYHIQDGQIIEIWESYDRLGLYQQMGLIPA
jgi:predicted ester cyclase